MALVVYQIPRDVFNPAMFVLDLTDEEIARQLTLIDYDIYAGIQVQELLQTAWNSDKLRHRSPHVCGLLNRLNKLAFFVPSLILWLDSKSLRAKMIEKFIRIAQLLRDMNNFNTLMGIVSGLNVSSVTRLRFTMAEVDQKLVAQFKRLEATMDPSSSFKNYRRAVRSAPMPALPYLYGSLARLTALFAVARALHLLRLGLTRAGRRSSNAMNVHLDQQWRVLDRLDLHRGRKPRPHRRGDQLSEAQDGLQGDPGGAALPTTAVHDSGARARAHLPHRVPVRRREGPLQPLTSTRAT